MNKSKIKSFAAIIRLHLEEDYGYHSMVRELAKLLTLPEDEGMVNEYDRVVVELDLALQESRKSSFTEKIHEADDTVDSLWRLVRSTVKKMVKYPDTATSVAAKEILGLVDKYGDITAMPYEEKYGCLDNLLKDIYLLGTEKQNLVGITQWVTELDNQRNSYVSARLARLQEKATHVKGHSAICRENADEAYEAFVERVNALALINGDANYLEFITALNALIDEQNAKLSARKTRAEHEKENEDVDPDLPVDPPVDPPIDPDLPAD